MTATSNGGGLRAEFATSYDGLLLDVREASGGAGGEGDFMIVIELDS